MILTKENMPRPNCLDCGKEINYESKICRPCNFKRRKAANKGIMDFVCHFCTKTYQRLDRGDIYNKKRRFCSQNCRFANDSACKEIDPKKRARNILARHRARGSFWKSGFTDLGIRPSDVPEQFEAMVKIYVARLEMSTLPLRRR